MALSSPTVTPIGVDIAKAKFYAAALVGGQYKTKVFPNTPAGFEAFFTWLRPFAPVHVCLEATGHYGEIHAFGKAELQRTKTDKTDAKLITRFC